MYVSTQQLCGLGACCPGKVLEFRGYEVASETTFGPKRCFSEARQQSFKCMNIYPFCPLYHIAPISAFRLSHKPHPSQTVQLERKIIVGRLVLSHCLHPSCLYCNISPCCVYARTFAEDWAYLATPSKPWVRKKVVQLKPD